MSFCLGRRARFRIRRRCLFAFLRSVRIGRLIARPGGLRESFARGDDSTNQRQSATCTQPSPHVRPMRPLMFQGKTLQNSGMRAAPNGLLEKRKSPTEAGIVNHPPSQEAMPVPIGLVQVTEVSRPGRRFRLDGWRLAAAPGTPHPGRSSGSILSWRNLLRCSPPAC